MIAYEDCGVKLTVPYHAKDLEGGHPQAGDKVFFYYILLLQSCTNVNERLHRELSSCIKSFAL